MWRKKSTIYCCEGGAPLYSERMSSLAIVDSSLLARNLYQVLLKPKGYSCYSFQNFDLLKTFFIKKSIAVEGIVISANAFREEADDQFFHYFRSDPFLKNLPKLFLFRHGEKKRKLKFQYLEKAFVLERPCHPTEIYEVIGQW